MVARSCVVLVNNMRTSVACLRTALGFLGMHEVVVDCDCDRRVLEAHNFARCFL
jgi:hypothetical protein